MKRAIFKEYEQYGDDLSGHCARFSYRLMNLCVKAEEVSLLPVEVLIDGDLQRIEECSKGGPQLRGRPDGRSPGGVFGAS